MRYNHDEVLNIGRGGRKRQGAGRRENSDAILSEDEAKLVNARAVLATIAADQFAPHARRVLAAKAMILAETSAGEVVGRCSRRSDIPPRFGNYAATFELRIQHMASITDEENDRIPFAETYKGVGIHIFQSQIRIAEVRAAIDAVYAINDMQALFDYAHNEPTPPEARLLASWRCEAMWEDAVRKREPHPDLDILRLRAFVVGLSSLKWINNFEYGSLLQCFQSPETPLTDDDIEAAGGRRERPTCHPPSNSRNKSADNPDGQPTAAYASRHFPISGRSPARTSARRGIRRP